VLKYLTNLNVQTVKKKMPTSQLYPKLTKLSSNRNRYQKRNNFMKKENKILVMNGLIFGTKMNMLSIIEALKV